VETQATTRDGGAGRAALIAVLTAVLVTALVAAIGANGTDRSTQAALTAAAPAAVAPGGAGAVAVGALAPHSDGHHHMDSLITYAQLPPATRAQVDRVIALWGHKYRTAADAQRDGWVKATRSLYGIGAHYLKGGVRGFLAGNGFDLEHPNIMLFDGEGADAKFAGVSYIVAGATPEGFAGPYDVWHRHSAVCFAAGLVISEGENEGSPIDLSDAGCKAHGGIMFPISYLSMIHLWIGPGYLGKAPIMAHDHKLLYDGYRPT
jgi:hypothetical protein